MLYPERPFLFYTLTYLPFLALLWWAKAQDGNRLVSKTGLTTNLGALLLLHAGGILLLGLTTLTARPLSALVSPSETRFQGPAVLLTVLLVLVLLLSAPRLAEKKYREMAPAVSGKPVLSGIYTSAYFLLRAAFICAYEIYFRGYLLHDSSQAFGIPGALALNIVLYAGLHVVNGKEEMLGCIPFGLLLCGLCLWQDAPWPAVAVHLALAIPYEVHFLRKLTTDKQAPHENFSNGSRWLPGH